mmetsp:Transcript_4014/g.11201  ORF Transcript_4014/g.11201 Transcript_4014/m.11201 type:complete len:545 (-) Transcript_4014:314-1948(-)
MVASCPSSSKATTFSVDCWQPEAEESPKTVVTGKALDKAAASPLASCVVELGLIVRLGWPNSVNQILSFMPGLAMLAFLGNDADHLAAAGMGFMFANVSGLSLVIGSGAGASPLISQAFGARNFIRCGDLLQRQIAIHAVIALFVAVVWLNTERILIAFQQPPVVARLTGEFMRWRIAALPFYALKEDFTNYLVAQRVMVTPMAVSIAASVLNVALFPMLIRWLGFPGAPLALTLANAVQALATWALAHRALPSAEAWSRWRLGAALEGWGEMLRMSLPAGIMMLSEWWGWETNLFFAGLLCDGDSGAGCIELDVFPIVSNTMVVAFMFQYGFSLAAGTLAGNALGEGDAAKARRTGKLAMLLVAGITGLVALVLVFLRRSWGLLFTADMAAVELTGRVLPFVAAYVFLDSLGPGALVCLLRGMGLVRLPAIITFVSFYIVGIPFGLLLTFGRRDAGWGIQGLWAGLVLGMFTMVSSLLAFFLWGIDWQAAAEVAQSRARSGHEGSKPMSSKADGAIVGKVLGKTSYQPVAAEGGSPQAKGKGP